MARKMHTQRDYIRRLFAQFRGDKDKVCSAYALAERDGVVSRNRNANAMSSENYALALWEDGNNKGWLNAKADPANDRLKLPQEGFSGSR